MAAGPPAGNPSCGGEAMEKKPIVMEADEVEDGSIFVCFMCEKEFNKVSLLNDHMQQHQNLPGEHSHTVSLVTDTFTLG